MYSLTHICLSPYPQLLETIIPLSVSLSLTFFSRSYNSCPSPSGLFHAAEHPAGSSMLSHKCRISFFMTEYFSGSMYVCVSHFLSPFIYWWTLNLFPYVDCCNNAAMNTGVQTSLQDTDFFSFSYPNQKWDFWDFLL